MRNQSEVILQLIHVIQDLAHDLEGEILARHGLNVVEQLSDPKIHPVTRMRAERDLLFVEEARSLTEHALAFVELKP